MVSLKRKCTVHNKVKNQAATMKEACLLILNMLNFSCQLSFLPFLSIIFILMALM